MEHVPYEESLCRLIFFQLEKEFVKGAYDGDLQIHKKQQMGKW